MSDIKALDKEYIANTYARFTAVVLLPSPRIALVTPMTGHFSLSGRVKSKFARINLYCSIAVNLRFL